MSFSSLLPLALAFQLSSAYLVAPPGTAAPGATAQCSAWAQATYGLTCAILEQYYGFTEAEFEQWNPSTALLGDGCNMIQGLYYCIQVNYVALATSKSSTSTKTSTFTSTPTSSATSSPSPEQSGIATNCNDFYFVVADDTCYDIASAEGISLDDFYAWNPAVGTSCGGLQAGYYVCVGVASSSTSTSTTLSISTVTSTTTAVSSPTRTGTASNCDDFYLVATGDSCYNIAADNGISLDDFYSWNPAVGNDCSGLWPDYYVCVGVVDSASTTTTTPSPTAIITPTTTASTGNAIATPTPTQAGMVDDCDNFYLVVNGDGCYDIAAAAGISLHDFYSWNSAVGSDCASLWPNYYVCIGIV